MKHDSFNESAEMYLKTVEELAVDDEPVPISAVAERLGVSSVSATEMIHRLAEHGLMVHRPYKGVSLTPAGRQQASNVVRIHRLWECFLADRLGLAWDTVHDLACRLEHATAPEIADALDRFLDHPAACPHGNPIPRVDGSPGSKDEVSLASLCPGHPAIISRIHPETDSLLAYLAGQGLVPGTGVTLVEIAPFNGPLVLSTKAGQHYLGQTVATHIFVQPEERAA